jgi:hypothetical protein
MIFNPVPALMLGPLCAAPIAPPSVAVRMCVAVALWAVWFALLLRTRLRDLPYAIHWLLGAAWVISGAIFIVLSGD